MPERTTKPTPTPSDVPPPFEMGLKVRFSDLDAFGHVNHATFLSYLEEARVAFFEENQDAGAPAPDDIILARAEIDYQRPIVLGERVTVRLWIERIGTKSFTFGYELVVEGELAAKARTVQVFYDYERGESLPIPDGARTVLEEAMKEGEGA